MGKNKAPRILKFQRFCSEAFSLGVDTSNANTEVVITLIANWANHQMMIYLGCQRRDETSRCNPCASNSTAQGRVCCKRQNKITPSKTREVKVNNSLLHCSVVHVRSDLMFEDPTYKLEAVKPQSTRSVSASLLSERDPGSSS